MRPGQGRGAWSRKVETLWARTAGGPLLDDISLAAKRTLPIALAIALCSSAPRPAVAGTNEPTLDRALNAPAADLAQGYLWVRFTLRYLIPAAKKGVRVHIGAETIDKKNVDEYERRYGSRLDTYRRAIHQRGYKTIAGHYRGEATQACTQAGSVWASLIAADRANDVEITQTGFEARLIVTARHNGARIHVDNAAAIVESSMVVHDRMHSDYFFRGKITDKGIRIKPVLSVLRAWPKWAHPPSRKALENCVVTLVKR